MQKTYETIIIGGGIAGLASARTLCDNGKDFILISNNIGGRVMTSDNGCVNYGAYFIGKDSTHIAPYLKRGKRFNNFDLTFHKEGRKYSIWSALAYPLQILRLLKEIVKFKSHYQKLKEKLVSMPSKEAIESDPYLLKLFNTRTDNLIKELKIPDLAERFINEFMYGILFLKPTKYYGFDFMRWMQYAVTPVYDFYFEKEKIIAGYEDKIFEGLATKIISETSGYKIITSDGKEYLAKNVVVATPITVAKELLNIPKIRASVDAHAFHVQGVEKKEWNDKNFDVFSAGSRIMDIACEGGNNYLVYSKNEKPPFKKFFESHEIVKHIFWSPAFNLSGSVLLDATQGKNLYLAGDYNLVGMEDAFLSGLYVANQILKK